MIGVTETARIHVGHSASVPVEALECFNQRKPDPARARQYVSSGGATLIYDKGLWELLDASIGMDGRMGGCGVSVARNSCVVHCPLCTPMGTSGTVETAALGTPVQLPRS